MASERWAVTFGSKYRHETHPVDERIDHNSFVVFEGTEEEARRQAFETFGGEWSFMYPYAREAGYLVPDFQRQIQEYGLTRVDLAEKEE